MSDDVRKEKFLEAFLESRGDLDAARKALRIGPSTFYGWIRDDPVFRERLDRYRLQLAEEVEAEAFRRVLNPKNRMGSDALVTTLLRGLKPERYREQNQATQQTQIIYVSSLRTVPRPGGGEVLEDGHMREAEPGDRVPQEERALPDPGRDEPGGARGAEDPGEEAPGLHPEGT